MEGRRAGVVLVDRVGDLLGSLSPIPVTLPYWPETAELVAAVQGRLGVTVDVLRMLEADRPVPHGGTVTYLAQVRGSDGGGIPAGALAPVGAHLDGLARAPEPLRLPYARPGGPSASVEWVLAHLPAGAAVHQQRTWNLSAIWLCESSRGRAWLKEVPPFLAHEAVVLRWLERRVPGSSPGLLAADQREASGRMLLADLAGTSMDEAGLADRLRILAVAERIHRASVDETDDLVASGVPDRRGPALVEWISHELSGFVDDRHPVWRLLDDLAETVAEVDDCGLPDTLVHGDLWPGNAVGHLGGKDAPGSPALLDWGDSFVGNPAFDALRLTGRLSPADRDALVQHWVGTWERTVPSCRPRRALQLLGPVAELRSAATYAAFLRRIEPGERPYHRADVPECLDRAVALAAAGGDLIG